VALSGAILAQHQAHVKGRLPRLAGSCLVGYNTSEGLQAAGAFGCRSRQIQVSTAAETAGKGVAATRRSSGSAIGRCPSLPSVLRLVCRAGRRWRQGGRARMDCSYGRCSRRGRAAWASTCLVRPLTRVCGSMALSGAVRSQPVYHSFLAPRRATRDSACIRRLPLRPEASSHRLRLAILLEREVRGR